jgi:hypothetical protein
MHDSFGITVLTTAKKKKKITSTLRSDAVLTLFEESRV